MRASDVWNRYVAPRRQGTASSKTGGAGQDDDRVETVAAVQPWTEAPSRTNHEAIESMEKRYESLLRTSVLDAMKKVGSSFEVVRAQAARLTLLLSTSGVRGYKD